MSKRIFLIGLVALLPMFALAVHMNRTQTGYVVWIRQTVALEGMWLVLSYLAWLGTRWHHGHWDANALSASSVRRRFLFVVMLSGALLSIWGGYLGIIERVFW